MMKIVLLLLCLCSAYALDTCGGYAYDHVKKICCSGRTFNRVANAACCLPAYPAAPPQGPNTTPHDGPGHPTPSPLPQVYDSKSQICCVYTYGNKRYGVVHARVANAVCCDRQVYDLRHQICYKSSVINVPQQNNEPAMCGDKLYDRRLQICCHDYNTKTYHLHTKRPEARCCLSVLYNTRHHICCAGVVSFKPEHGRCCKATPYDSVNSICCSGYVTAVPFHLRPAGCCKGTIFSYKDHVCCGGVVSHKANNNACCATNPYDQMKQICCLSTVKTRVPNSKCCGVNVYNELTQVCCKGRITSRPVNAAYLRF